MLLINFGHPLTAHQKTQLENLTAWPLERLIEIAVQISEDALLEAQARNLVEQTGLATEEWQTSALLINLPGYSTLAAYLLAEIEGRSGHLPAIVKLRPVSGQLLTEYEVSQIINLAQLRATARTRRQAPKS